MSATASVRDRAMPRVGRHIILNPVTVTAPSVCMHRECAQALTERVATWANAITLTRTVAAVVLALSGARTHSLTLLLSALGAYWIGDIADGFVARRTGTETRFGAAMDIMCDRISAAVFTSGLRGTTRRCLCPSASIWWSSWWSTCTCRWRFSHGQCPVQTISI